MDTSACCLLQSCPCSLAALKAGVTPDASAALLDKSVQLEAPRAPLLAGKADVGWGRGT